MNTLILINSILYLIIGILLLLLFSGLIIIIYDKYKKNKERRKYNKW